MKTLDDVIEAMERCSIPHYFDCKGCPYEDDDAEVGCRSDDRDADALHYLKTYRENQQTYIENSRKAEEARERYLEAVKNCELAENKYRKLYEETSQKLRNTSQITCPKCHSEFVILDDPDGDHQQLEKCRALLQDFYRNDPLTWDELRTMEGKPVWVEEQYSFTDEWHGYWEVISSFCDDEFVDDPDPVVYMTDEEIRHKKDLGIRWQAYRKER